MSNVPLKEKVNKLIIDSFEEGYILDDILEILNDYKLLNKEGEEVRSMAFEQIYKGNEGPMDILERSWKTFDDYTKKYFIENRNSLNGKAKDFINNKILGDVENVKNQ